MEMEDICSTIISSFETLYNKTEHSINHGVSDFQKTKANPQKKAVVIELRQLCGSI